MALLSGIGILVFPAAEAAGGQIYKYFGYYAVYGSSLALTVIGLTYLYFVPESVTARVHLEGSSKPVQDDSRRLSVCKKIIAMFKQGNKTLMSSIRCVVDAIFLSFSIRI